MHDAISQGGYANVPWLEQGEKEVSPLAQSYAAENKSGDIHNEAAESMYNFDKSVKGGNTQTDGEGGYTRTTEHTPFYTEFYKQNGKAPTKADYIAAAKNQLDNGGGNLVAPEQADAYQLAQEREASNKQVPSTTEPMPEPTNIYPDAEQRVFDQNPMNQPTPYQLRRGNGVTPKPNKQHNQYLRTVVLAKMQ
jgi:hypothetical protein